MPAYACRTDAGPAGNDPLAGPPVAQRGLDSGSGDYGGRRAGGCAADGGGRLEQPAGHHLLRARQDARGAGVHRQERLRHAGRHLQRAREASRPLLQPLRRCGDAVHAAPHLVGHRAALGRIAGPPGLARLHPHAARFRRAAVRREQDGHAGGGRARRHEPRRNRPSGAVQARCPRRASRWPPSRRQPPRPRQEGAGCKARGEPGRAGKPRTTRSG